MPFVKLSTKYQLPPEVSEQMKLYRVEGDQVPKMYSAFHMIIADMCICQLENTYGFVVEDATTGDDGWGDGMEIRLIEGKTKSGKFLKLKYHAGNQHFMIRSDHGNTALFVSDLS